MAGFIPIGQYTWLFIMSFNPLIFKLFKPHHWVLLAIGIAGALFNHRAVLPLMLLICLDLDFSKLTDRNKKIMILFVFIQLFVIFAFGSETNV